MSEKEFLDELKEFIDQGEQPDAYMDQESFHKELDFAFSLIERTEQNRMWYKTFAVAMLITSMIVPSTYQIQFCMTFGLLTLLGLECHAKVRLDRLHWLYDTTVVKRMTDDTSGKYNLNLSQVSYFDFSWIPLFDFDTIPFFLLIWATYFLSSGVLA